MLDIPNLKEITYELTTLCGADCVMCARNRYSKKGQNMALEDARNYTRKAVAAGYNAIILGGMGDPLMYPRLAEFLSGVKEEFPWLSIRLTTTGQFMDETMLDLLCRYVDILKISNYGFTGPVYEAVHRGSLVFEKVQKNLQALLSVKGRRPYIIMSYLDMPVNHEEVIPWVDYWSRQGLDEVNVWKAHNWGGYTAGREEISCREVFCGRVKNRHFKVWADGTVSMCVFDCERTLVIGDLKQDDFDRINRRYEQFRAVHEQGDVAHCGLICRACDQIFDRDPAMLYLMEYGRVVRDWIHSREV